MPAYNYSDVADGGRLPIGVGGLNAAVSDKEPESAVTGMKVEPVYPDRPSLLGAAWRQENLMGSAIESLARPDFEMDPTFDVMDVIKGTKYEDRGNRFVGTLNADDARWRMAKIDREESDDQRILEGGIPGIVLMMAMGVADPTMFIPLVGQAKLARGVAIAGRGIKALSEAKVGIGAAEKAVEFGKVALKGAVSKQALKGGASVAVAAGVQEGVLQATQETRPWEVTALGIGAGAVLGGLIGGGAAFLSKRKLGKLTEEFSALRRDLGGDVPVIDDASIGRIAAGAMTGHAAGAAAVVDSHTGKLAPAFGVEKATARASALQTTQTSPFRAARDIARHISDGGMMYDDASKGMVTSPGGTMENRIKLWNGGLFRSIRSIDDAYQNYWFGSAVKFGRVRSRVGSEWARMRGSLGGRLTAREFREQITEAMGHGDVHPIPEVQEAARVSRTHGLDPLYNESISRGLVERVEKVVGQETYTPRLFIHDKIVAGMGTDKGLDKTLFRYFRRQNGPEVIDDGELKDTIDDIMDHILGLAPGRMSVPSDLFSLKRGPMMARVLNVPNSVLKPWLEQDIEDLLRMYHRTMAPDVEVASKFGDLNLTEHFGKLKDEFMQRVEAATTAKEKLALKKRYNLDRDNITNLIKRIRGMYGLPANPRSVSYRAGHAMRELNYVRLLGGMTLRAIPDLARPVTHYGMDVFKDAAVPLFRHLAVGDFRTLGLVKSELQAASIALDMVLDTRTKSLADTMGEWQPRTRGERALHHMSNRMGLVSLMAPWNASLKLFTGLLNMNRMMRFVEKVSNGTATAKQLKALANANIDEEMARRIWQQFNAPNGGSRSRGIYLTNTQEWLANDRLAAETFQTALLREVDRTIVTPGAEKPLFMSRELGATVGQFKTFAAVSLQRMIIAGLQQRDMAFVSGTLLATALGGLGTQIQSGWLKGEDTSKWGYGKWVKESVDYAGILGLLSDVNNIGEKLTEGRVGLSALTGGGVAERYKSRSDVGAILGPTIEGGWDLAKAVVQGPLAALTEEDWSASDTRRMRKLLPYQNIFYLRQLFDRIEKGFNDSMGFRQKDRPGH